MSNATRKKSRTHLPSLRHCNGRGFVELNGQRCYLGPWGKPETQAAYERKVAEWFTHGRQLPVAPEEITVAEICAAYYTHCEAYFRQPDGTHSSSLDRVKQSLKPLKAIYASSPAAKFGPLALRSIRQGWVTSGLSRSTCNDYVAVIKQLFKWAVAQEMIPASVYQGLATLDHLRAGRSDAKECEPVQSVLLSHVQAIQPFVSRQVWALVQLQLLSGARPGELLQLRPIDIDTSGEIWCSRLKKHKTAYRGKKRVVHFGPRAQQVLVWFMQDRPLDAYLFSPREAEAERHAKAPTHRRKNQKQNARRTNRKLGEFYTVDSYRSAVERACETAKVPHWTPRQLRHTAATEIRKIYGLEAAQVTLGHSHADVTQIYAEANRSLAIKVAKEVG